MSATQRVDKNLFDHWRRLPLDPQRLEVEGRGKECSVMHVHQMSTGQVSGVIAAWPEELRFTFGQALDHDVRLIKIVRLIKLIRA